MTTGESVSVTGILISHSTDGSFEDFLPLENDPLISVRHAKQFTDPTTM